MAIVNATDVVLKLDFDSSAASDYDKLLHATSANLSISREMRDSTTKDSSGFSTSLPGLKSFEISGDGFVDVDTTADAHEVPELITEMISAANPEVAIQFSVGSKNYTGKGFISSINIDAGVEENATYSITITGSGALTV
tara:strand:- start:563 stop:982 length:420 start_codon:yes stop_codon:yes gene_type:complete